MPGDNQPPDGGFRAYTVLVASFLCNGLLFGIINSYSILYIQINKNFELNGVENPSSKASLIGSLMIGITFLLSMISGLVSDYLGIRPTTFIGGIIITSSLLISSFLIYNVYWLIFTLGVLYGIGASLIYTPSLTIIGHYFKKNIGIANGFVTLGSSVFSIIMPYLLEYLLNTVGLHQCLRYLAVLVSSLMLCSLAFKPRFKPSASMKTNENNSHEQYFSDLINISIWRNKRYLIWVIGVSVALCGYLVPFVHLAKFVEQNYPGKDNKKPLVCIAITSAVGRIFFGRLSDLKWINSILLQQLSFLIIGTVAILIPLVSGFYYLLGLSLFLGMFDGCFISVVGPIAFSLCGPKGAGQAIGFFLGFISIPMTIGPPIAGWIYDRTLSYTTAFIIAGIPPFIGAAIMTRIHFMNVSDDDLECQESIKSMENKQLTSEGIGKGPIDV